MKRLTAYCALISLTVQMAVMYGPANAASSPSKTKAAVTSTQADTEAISAQLDSLAKDVAAGDVNAIIELWSPDGSYTDDNGEVYQGREALKKRFSQAAAAGVKPSVTLKPDSTKLLSNSIGVVEGSVLRKDGDGKSIPQTRFSMVFSKIAGKWQIVSATETPIAATDNDAAPAVSIQDLSWLIGDWKADRNGNSLRLHADWAGNKKFIKLNYQITKAGQPTEEDTEVIGIDPRSQEIASWCFDSTGAIGQSTWAKNDKSWQAESAKTLADGTNLTAVNIFTPSGSDKFMWQSINRTSSGLPLSDTAELAIERTSR